MQPRGRFSRTPLAPVDGPTLAAGVAFGGLQEKAARGFRRLGLLYSSHAPQGQVAKAFARDMRAFHAKPNAVKRERVASAR
jgi:hypothetical protein